MHKNKSFKADIDTQEREGKGRYYQETFKIPKDLFSLIKSTQRRKEMLIRESSEARF